MHEAFSEEAILCRTGGDEFMVCLVGEKAERVGELVDVLKASEMEYDYEGVLRKMTISIGHSLHAGRSFDLKEAFTQADTALYADKRGKKTD